MAGRGFVAEGWNYSQAGNPGPRYNDTLFRGQLSVTGSATVTLPLPIRFAGFAQATIVAATAGVVNTGAIVTVGTFSNNTFKIFVWIPTSSSLTTLIASTTATPVDWMAWGSVTDDFASGAY